MTEDRIRDLLRDMRDDAVPADSVARVHANVSQRIASSSHRGFAWRLAGALALAACVVIAVFVFRRSEPKALPTTTVAVPPSDSQLIPAAVPPPLAPRRIRKAPAPAIPRGGAALIRIETPDPDVVILLIGEE